MHSCHYYIDRPALWGQFRQQSHTQRNVKVAFQLATYNISFLELLT